MTGPQPTWTAVPTDTQAVLDLVADTDHPSVDLEWEVFKKAVQEVAAEHEGLVSQNAVRPKIRGRVAPKRIGAFYNRACSRGILQPTGDWELSRDREGRNAGRPSKVYALGDAA